MLFEPPLICNLLGLLFNPVWNFSSMASQQRSSSLGQSRIRWRIRFTIHSPGPQRWHPRVLLLLLSNDIVFFPPFYVPLFSWFCDQPSGEAFLFALAGVDPQSKARLPQESHRRPRFLAYSLLLNLESEQLNAIFYSQALSGSKFSLDSLFAYSSIPCAFCCLQLLVWCTEHTLSLSVVSVFGSPRPFDLIWREATEVTRDFRHGFLSIRWNIHCPLPSPFLIVLLIYSFSLIFSLLEAEKDNKWALASRGCCWKEKEEEGEEREDDDDDEEEEEEEVERWRRFTSRSFSYSPALLLVSFIAMTVLLQFADLTHLLISDVIPHSVVWLHSFCFQAWTFFADLCSFARTSHRSPKLPMRFSWFFNMK